MGLPVAGPSVGSLTEKRRRDVRKAPGASKYLAERQMSWDDPDLNQPTGGFLWGTPKFIPFAYSAPLK